MAIFARLVCMLVSVLVSGFLAAGFVATLGGPQWAQVLLAAVGALAGIRIGHHVGIMIAGKPPQN
jgi:uncharacterized membrane protein YfcA